MSAGGDDDGGEDESAAAEAEGGTDTTTPAPPPDLPRGEPLATSTIADTLVDGTFWNVWLVESDGTGARALTRENEDKARLPVLSPDRRSVAYSVEAAGGLELRVTDSDSTGLARCRPLSCPTPGRPGRPTAAATRSSASATVPTASYVLDLASGELTNLTGTPEDEADPAWSPDGTTTACRSTVDGDQDLWTVDVETGTTATVTSAPENEADPAWSPDGSALAYSSDAGGDWEIHTVGTQGQGTVRLSDNDGDDQDPAYSPNGVEIAVESKRDSLDRPDDDWAEIYVMATDGSGQRRVTVRDGLDVHPAWGIAPP